MKQTIILFFLLCISFFLKAQSNLQLNQVLTYNGALNSWSTSPVYSVPNGKVWKIEARSQDYLKINGSWYTGGSATFTYKKGVSTGSQLSLPIWLKAGDNVYYEVGEDLGATSYQYFISILEFNIAQ